MTPDLSLLICSLHDRSASLATLLECLAAQPAEHLARTQILVDIDDIGTTGAKRQRLLERACGRYVAFIDDDDLVSEEYLAELFCGIEEGVDHIGVRMLFCNTRERTQTPVECSMHHAWEFKGGVYLRSAQHVCAVRRELALQAGFDDKTIGEDRSYAERLNPLIATERLTSVPVYLYIWRPK